MSTATPGADAPDDLAAAPPTAPAVVAVVVARNPGPWFEETMASLAAQDYPNLSILVVDASSEVEVKPRVASAAPGAFVRRLAENPGYGAAANEVLEVVEGAAFYLVCHDDVALAPDALRLLVEEAFRSNAGAVGPKLVDWHEPRRLLQLGEGLDHAGYASPLIERGELDQEQHDAVRDVFTIPGACTLVRADLFAAIGGYDEGIDYHLDDVSLCWRAHLAGARVVVAPAARVRHLEALSIRRPVDDRRRLQARHRLRVVLSCYAPLGLVLALPKLIVLQILEVLYALLVGRTAQAKDLVSSWIWNARRLGDLRAARAQVASFRQVSDREIRRFMTRGSARFRQFARGQIGAGEDRLTGLARGGRDVAGSLRSGSLQAVVLTWGAVALVLIAGSRHLITRGVPAVGELVPFTEGPGDLLETWASGWRTAGLGSESPQPTALGVFGVLGLVSVGAMGLLRTIVTVGLIPLGAILAYRLPAPTGSRQAQLVAAVVYVSNPLPYNALAAGRWGPLVLYAGLPLVVRTLGRAARLAPFVPLDGETAPGMRLQPMRHHVVALGVTVALMATVVPVAVPLVVGVGVTLALGTLLAGQAHGIGRLVVAATGGAALAVLLHLPWSLDLLLPGTPLSAIIGPEGPAPTEDLAALLRFEVGPLGAAPLGWAILAPAVLALLIGRGARHAWAVRGWTVAVVFWGAAWVSARGSAPVAMPSVDVLLTPAALGLALAAAMGVSAFQVDLPGYRFGWRQIASGLAALGILLAAMPVIGAAFDGRWSMPAGDHARALGFVDDEAERLAFRVLWLGQPTALPTGSFELEPGLAYATSSHGMPRLEDLLTGSDDGRTRLLADALDLARTGQTARLGRLLAPMGVRYVVVAERLAPAPFSTEPLLAPGALSSTLAAQLDLEPLDVPAGLTVYRNEAFAPARALVPADHPLPEQGGISTAENIDLGSLAPALGDVDGDLRFTGLVEADTSVFLSAAHSSRWELTVDGEKAEQRKPFGWANEFVVPRGGEATLRFRTSPLRYAVLALQTVVWLWLIRRLVRAGLNPAGRTEAAA